MNISFKNLLGLTLLGLMLNACGGGSGGSSEVGGLDYEGRTSPANISSKNATDLTRSAVSVYDLVGNDNLSLRSELSNASISNASGYVSKGFEVINKIRKSLVADFMKSPANPMLAYRTDVDLDLNQECDAGTWKIVGYVEESDNTAELTSLFDGCQIDGDRIDGELKFDILNFDFDAFLAFDVKLSFEKLRIRNDDGDISIGGDSRYTIDLAVNKESQTVTDLVIRDNDSDEMLRIVDLVSVYTYDDVENPASVTIDIKSGRIYDSRYGYVKVTSPVMISFASIFQDFPDSGQYRLVANGRIRVTAQAGNMVRIEADTDDDLGNGYEFDQTISWNDL